ncbi:restriction endonuclease subunit S [Halomonas korlensis]|uniref:Type I restriction enzyme, S subunit n=1 Tax=Halomonas korlensis TaxID=463301 RepID=A0A1I7HAG3_9GAMM|nr:restriction endonuclease subunit S [Halomonas korlensis]SFU57700.1 type I restriction enzyme, S subunit [Halomonas korlensis]
MDAQHFLAEFGHIANAPGGVARLRELVLQLAASGRLVERSNPETPIVDTLAAVEKQRKDYKAQLSLRSSRGMPSNQTEPFIIPCYWEWVQLEQISLYVQRGKGPKYSSNGSVRVISQKCVQWSGFDIRQARFITDESVKSYGIERFLCDGDLLWNSTGTGTAGRVAIYHDTGDNRVVADSHITVVRLADALPRYLWCVIASPWIQTRIHPTHPESLVSGTTQQVELGARTVRTLPIPLPPVEEQARIVVKVDELMALCDKLEAQQRKRRRLQNALRQATLKTVVSAESPHELQESWSRLEENFEQLFNAPEDVKEFRTILLELAIKGLLTRQKSGESASDIIRLLAQRNQANNFSSRKSRLNQQQEISGEELPFPLPNNWVWLRLSSLGSFLGGGTPRKSNPDYWRGDVPWVSPKDMKVNRINNSKDSISQEAVEETSVKLIPSGALLVVVRGMILAHSFPVGLAGRELTINQDMKALCPYFPEMSEFLLLLLLGSKRRFLGMVERSTHGTCRLQTERFASSVVGIPPLVEQKRIVARVTELIHACDTLESQLQDANNLSERLAISSISALTGITIEQEEDQPVKAPQTELVAKLRLGETPDIKAQAPLATVLARHNGEMSAKDLWQRFGGEIDAFYAQLKTEIAHGWVLEPEPAKVREIVSEEAGA